MSLYELAKKQKLKKVKASDNFATSMAVLNAP